MIIDVTPKELLTVNLQTVLLQKMKMEVLFENFFNACIRV